MYRFFFFFFNDTATTEIYTLSLHDALPIYPFHRFSFCHRRECLPTDRSLVTFDTSRDLDRSVPSQPQYVHCGRTVQTRYQRSEEHTSELQSRLHLVCRLLLEKKKDTPLALLTYRSTGRPTILRPALSETPPANCVVAATQIVHPTHHPATCSLLSHHMITLTT